MTISENASDKKQILIEWLKAADLFSQPGGAFSGVKGGNFYEFAEATVKASRGLSLPGSARLGAAFDALKDSNTDTGGKLNVVAFEKQLLDRNFGFYGVFANPFASVGGLYRRAIEENLYVDSDANEKKRYQLWGNIVEAKKLSRFGLQ